MNNFFSELKRRNVYKAAVAYAVVAWLLIQIATQVFPFLEIPAWAIRLVIVLLALGFPVALLLAWALELTPEGIRRTSETGFPGRSGRSWLWVVLIAAIGAGSLLWFQLTARVKTPEPGPKSIAVLPFENLSENKETSYFVDGIQDEVITRLAKGWNVYPAQAAGTLIAGLVIEDGGISIALPKLDPMLDHLRRDLHFDALAEKVLSPKS